MWRPAEPRKIQTSSGYASLGTAATAVLSCSSIDLLGEIDLRAVTNVPTRLGFQYSLFILHYSFGISTSLTGKCGQVAHAAITAFCKSANHAQSAIRDMTFYWLNDIQTKVVCKRVAGILPAIH
jgi:hypothetical protein